MARLSKILADNIREFAEQRGYTINALADFAHVSRSQLFEVVKEGQSPTVDWLEKIAAALNVAPWELLRESASSQKQSS